MRSINDVSAELEHDRLGREAEVRTIERFLAESKSNDERRILRRSLILLAYAHFEGFCKFALTAYVSAINSFGLKCDEASIPIVAAALTKVFDALRDENKKHDLFRSSLKNDIDVHRMARQQEFVARYESDVSNTVVSISDGVVDAKSNLNSVVLKRNLFMLGLPYPFLDKHRSSIDKLLHVRNSIAHGDTLADPKPEDLASYLETTRSVMSEVQGLILSSLTEKQYLKAS